jgi:radical SAM superfamily enzyme YgiQ (UPF0313 family)
MKPGLILINPWIYDFAAFDLWSKPLGLLYIAGTLREFGFRIHLIDCLDVHHPGMESDRSIPLPRRQLFGTGKFWRKEVPKPHCLKQIPRPFSRYGISKELFVHELKRIKNPSAILVTSLMTYWYLGVKEVISLAREIHPEVPVLLGGVYANLCREHALEFSGADQVVGETGLTATHSVLAALRQYGIEGETESLESDRLPYPAFDMLHGIDYVCLLTSTGCPYRCRYCASHFLNSNFLTRDPHHVLEEILYWVNRFEVRDFAFYDDALLVGFDNHLAVILEELVRLDLKLRFHTPNALHLREITPEVARLLYLSGFRTIRLGLETSDMNQHDEIDHKVSAGEFENAVHDLHEAGFTKREIGAYILMGLPAQSVDSVRKTIEFVGRLGVTPYLAEYSPIPHTLMWEMALEHSDYELALEPLFHNNSLLPCWDKAQRARVPEIKKRVQAFRMNRA